MKAILEFNLDDEFDSDRHVRAVNADNLFRAIDEIHNEIFRPARKHGYSDESIEELLEDKSEELIGKLEEKFYRILNDFDIRMC